MVFSISPRRSKNVLAISFRVALSGLRAKRVDCWGADNTPRRDDHSERY